MLTDAFLLKLGVAAAITPPIVSDLFVVGKNLPFFNVTLSTLGMAAAGSLIAFAYGAPVESRRSLYGFAIGGTFVGIWGLQFMLWQGVVIVEEYRPPVAAMIALLSRWIIPFLVENFPMVWDRIFNNVRKGE